MSKGLGKDGRNRFNCTCCFKAHESQRDFSLNAFCLCVGTSSDELMQLSRASRNVEKIELLRRNFRQTVNTHLVYDLFLMSAATWWKPLESSESIRKSQWTPLFFPASFCWTRKCVVPCWMLELNNKQTNHFKIFFKGFFLCHKNARKQKINYSNSLRALRRN